MKIDLSKTIPLVAATLDMYEPPSNTPISVAMREVDLAVSRALDGKKCRRGLREIDSEPRVLPVLNRGRLN